MGRRVEPPCSRHGRSYSAGGAMTKLSFPLSVRCVVIDLDGTLLDTVEDLAIAINLLFDQLGRPPLDVSLVRTFVGKGIAHLVRRALASSYRAEPDAALLER